MRSALLLAFALAGGCSMYDTDYGPTPFLCGPADQDPRCPEGYACMLDPGSGSEVCVENGGSISQDFDCADDSAKEPDDLLAMATVTQLDAMRTETIDGRSVCPAGDKDTYAIDIRTTNEDLSITVTMDQNGAKLRAALLNTGGVPISVAMPINGDATMISAEAMNLPVGMYYAQVYGPAGGDLQVNNYKITLTVSGP
ncbi:MAG TPA: hypothetical protein VMZ53_08225 [Kofleriaceae bacterium]|nr:hypothetical protein [Kofleriaceae bacterium]